MLYIIIKWLFLIPIAILLPTRVLGIRYLQPKKGAILVCNHLSYFDVLVLAIACVRPIYFMAKSELFKYPMVGWFFRKLNAFPVKRGTPDLGAIKRCIELVQKGHILGVFPEGTTKGQVAGPVTEMKQGAALIALKSNAEIIPAIFKKKPGILRFNTLIVGKPFRLDEFNNRKFDSKLIDEVTEKIKGELNKLVQGK